VQGAKRAGVAELPVTGNPRYRPTLFGKLRGEVSPRWSTCKCNKWEWNPKWWGAFQV
jgi:hypothetical protein